MSIEAVPDIPDPDIPVVPQKAPMTVYMPDNTQPNQAIKAAISSHRVLHFVVHAQNKEGDIRITPSEIPIEESLITMERSSKHPYAGHGRIFTNNADIRRQIAINWVEKNCDDKTGLNVDTHLELAVLKAKRNGSH